MVKGKSAKGGNTAKSLLNMSFFVFSFLLSKLCLLAEEGRGREKGEKGKGRN